MQLQLRHWQGDMGMMGANHLAVQQQAAQHKDHHSTATLAGHPSRSQQLPFVHKGALCGTCTLAMSVSSMYTKNRPRTGMKQ